MKEVVLITGATSGIGKAMAESLANEGYKVYGTGRNIPETCSIANLTYKYLDVRNSDSVLGAVKFIMEKEGRIDILINNAGLGLAGALEEIPFEDIHNTLETNFVGIIRMIKQVIPAMRQQGSGLIVNISSIGGRVGLPFQSIYSASKFAVESLTEAISIELKPFGIKVCMIEPGDYNTNVNHNRKAIQPSNDSPYYKRIRDFFDLLKRNINQGSEPEKMGRLIVKVVRAKSPRLRYKSGKFFEKITPLAKQLIPDRIFERLLTFFYKL